MPKTIKADETGKKATSPRDKIKKEHAGKYIAWTPDGRRIVAVASTFDAAERKAHEAGYPTVAVMKVPKHRSLG